MGPVATAVIEHAPQPVLAVRPGGPAARFQKILCAVDQSGPAARGLRNAIRLARAFGGQLVVLTVVPAVTPAIAAAVTGRFADEQTKFEAHWQGEFMKVLTDSDLSGVHVTKEVRHGLAHRQILTAAEEHRADLIVMGATGRTGLARVLVGSTTRRVLEHLPCSLLTVKQEDVVEELVEDDIRTVHQLMAEARELMASASFDKAGAKYRQVLTRNPFHVAAVEGLAEVSDKLGDSVRAQFYRRRAQALRSEAQA
jgi:nucleotide-binding universal stress UspA family protein